MCTPLCEAALGHLESRFAACSLLCRVGPTLQVAGGGLAALRARLAASSSGITGRQEPPTAARACPLPHQPYSCVPLASGLWACSHARSHARMQPTDFPPCSRAALAGCPCCCRSPHHSAVASHGEGGAWLQQGKKWWPVVECVCVRVRACYALHAPAPAGAAAAVHGPGQGVSTALMSGP